MLELLSEQACFGGSQRLYQHHSNQIGLPMRFAVYVPPQAMIRKVPALFYLAGLTCTEETFMIKAGAQRIASWLGMILIAPDTSPRQAGVPGEAASWDLGLGAGFYVDATEPPWNTHYRMYSYVLELRELCLQAFPIHPERMGIMGHSMGGHGALVLALRNRERFSSVSALAPIAAPTGSPWGRKAFSAYLGQDERAWQQYDASALMAQASAPFPAGIRIDQGLRDPYLKEQLMPEAFERACAAAHQPLTLRRHAQYDHGYYFIATVIDEHIRFHYRALTGIEPA